MVPWLLAAHSSWSISRVAPWAHVGIKLWWTSLPKGMPGPLPPALCLSLQGLGGTQMPVECLMYLKPERLMGRDGVGGRIVGGVKGGGEWECKEGELYQTHTHTHTQEWMMGFVGGRERGTGERPLLKSK